MKARLIRAAFLASALTVLGACAVSIPPGEEVYAPPVVVEEPEVSVWAWWPWPHYEVEHRYVVENDRVIIRDRHYFPSNGRSRAYIRNDRGKHQGWYKHRR